jgi:ABC-2 type transport system permease protein
MLDLLRSEVFRLNRRSMPKVLLLVAALTVMAISLITWGAAQTGQLSAEDSASLMDSLALGSTLEVALGFASVFGSLFVIILTASVVATEYGWGTIRALLPRGSGRGAYLTAKLIVLAVFTLLVVLVTVAASYVASAMVTLAEDLDRSLDDGFVGELVFGVGRAWFAILPYLALAFMVALLTKSSAAGISVATAILFLEGQILSLVAAGGGLLERLPEFFISKNVEALMSVNIDGRTVEMPAPWQAAAVLTIYTVAFLAIAFWAFRRRDVTVG